MDMRFVRFYHFDDARKGDRQSHLYAQCGERTYRGGKLSFRLLGPDARSRLVWRISEMDE